MNYIKKLFLIDSKGLISNYKPYKLKFTYYKFSYSMHHKNFIIGLYLTQNCHLIIGDSKRFLNINFNIMKIKLF